MIERATREQVPELRALWQGAFGDGEAYLDQFFARVFVPDNTLVWLENGHVVSVLYILPYIIPNGEENLRAAYLYALATEPAWRGRKIMSRLIEASFDLCAARGYALSILVPAKDSLFGFYRSFGFEEYFDRVRIEKTRGEMSALGAGCEPAKLVQASTDMIWRQYRHGPFCGDGCVSLSMEQNAFYIDILRAEGGDAFVFTAGGAPCYVLLSHRGKELVIYETNAEARELGPLCAALCERFSFERATFFQPQCFGKLETRRGRRPFAMAKFLRDVTIEKPFIGRVLL
ncbi:MAG: GNAT family N-acetyltransferase [Oscillospiraceae bacterium]|jgi:GNAT superfamily N-acetyltransferase